MSIQLARKFMKDDFQKANLLGEGAFGKVYSIYDKNLGKTVVVKQISRKKASEKDILAEVSVLSQLRHLCGKKVLCYIDFMESDKSFYIVTEYLGEYQTLLDFIRGNSPLTPERFITLIDNLTEGMNDFHMTGVAHRDIKPENIMINPINLDIKYIDFGLACRADTCYKKDKMGTYYYFAPELLSASDADSIQLPETLSEWIKVDYWALGMTMLEIMSKNPVVLYYANLYNESNPENPDFLIKLGKNLAKTGVTSDVIDKVCNFDIPKENVIKEHIMKTVKPLLEGDPRKRQLIIKKSACFAYEPTDVTVSFSHH